MKKLAVVVMAMVFALSFALAAYAADAPSDTAVVAKGDTKITLGGEIRFRGEYTHMRYNQLDEDNQYYSSRVVSPFGVTLTKNMGPIVPNNDHQAYYDGRVRISLDAKVSDSVEGFVELESGTGNTSDTWVWGNTGADSTYGGGATGTGSTGTYASGNSKVGSLYIRQAWIKYEQPMYGVKVGHQLLMLGNGLFFDHTKYGDDAIVVWVSPTKNFTVAGLTAKFREGTGATSALAAQTAAATPGGTGLANDADAYVLLATYKGSNFNVSADVTAVNDQSISVTTPIAGGPSFNDNVHLWNFGLRGDGQISALTLRGDLELQTGTWIHNTPGQSDGRFRGWAALAGLDYKIGPVKLTGEFAYGSGQAGDDTGNDIKTFITSLGNDQHYTYVYEYRVKSATGGISTGLANTLYVKGGANVEITKQLSAEAYLYWLYAAKAVALNDAGGFIAGVPYNPNYSRNLGWELDAKVTYAFAKNLKYWVEGGYFWTGTAYDYRTSQTTYVNVTNPAYTYNTYTYSRDNAYAIRNGIQLNF
ncbi:MAG: alginate export family protein [Nitrospirae bacterium]|nr:alginate export family protein [Nitrospirota bacterium]